MLDFGVLLLLIIELVFVCFILVYKEECVKVSGILLKFVVFNFVGDKKELIEKICEVLYFSKLMSYV